STCSTSGKATLKAKRLDSNTRQAIVVMLAEGQDRDAIATRLGVTRGQVSAVAAHVTMGTYGTAQPAASTPFALDAPHDQSSRRATHNQRLAPVFLGTDRESGADVFWNPDPDSGTANPHTLVVGESGFGKTYAVSSLLAELHKQRMLAVVFDYGQGFTRDAAP